MPPGGASRDRAMAGGRRGGQDITETNELMDESKRVADALTRLIETANAPTFGISTTGQVTEWNRMVANITGYSKAERGCGGEALGTDPVNNIISKQYKDPVSKVLKAALSGQDTPNFESPPSTKEYERSDLRHQHRGPGDGGEPHGRQHFRLLECRTRVRRRGFGHGPREQFQQQAVQGLREQGPEGGLERPGDAQLRVPSLHGRAGGPPTAPRTSSRASSTPRMRRSSVWTSPATSLCGTR